MPPRRVADYVVLNKVDMMDGPTMDSLSAIVASLNPLAQVACRRCARGLARPPVCRSAVRQPRLRSGAHCMGAPAPQVRLQASQSAGLPVGFLPSPLPGLCKPLAGCLSACSMC